MPQHYILQRHKQLLEQRMDFYTSTGIHVYFKDPIENGIDLEQIISKIESTLPEHLLGEVEMIIVGQFDEFEERDLDAFYDGGTLYISQEQDDEKDMYDNIVHEIAHSLEQPYGPMLYQDGKIEREFLEKRRHLHKILWQMGYKLPEAAFLNPEYDEEFDMFLYEKIGYDKLGHFIQGLFITPYAVTSLREYFATGFVEYYLDPNHSFLKTTSPKLFNKLFQLQDPEELDNSY